MKYIYVLFLFFIVGCDQQKHRSEINPSGEENDGFLMEGQVGDVITLISMFSNDGRRKDIDIKYRMEKDGKRHEITALPGKVKK